MPERAWRRLVLHGHAHGLAPDDALKAHAAHQPLDGAARHLEPLPQHLPPDLAHAVDLEVLGPKTRGVFGCKAASRFARAESVPGSARLGGKGVVDRRGDRQNLGSIGSTP
jgi:hypothetical protein